MRHRFTTPTAGTAECAECGDPIDPTEEGGDLCTPCAAAWEAKLAAEEESQEPLFRCGGCAAPMEADGLCEGCAGLDLAEETECGWMGQRHDG